MADRVLDDIAQRLTYMRDHRRLSTAELARRAAIHPSTLTNIFLGIRPGANLKAHQLARLAEALHMSVDWLLGLWDHESEMPSTAGETPDACVG
jgi:transcriptional regulator with XRE-family HTH domain